MNNMQKTSKRMYLTLDADIQAAMQFLTAYYQRNFNQQCNVAVCEHINSHKELLIKNNIDVKFLSLKKFLKD